MGLYEMGYGSAPSNWSSGPTYSRSLKPDPAAAPVKQLQTAQDKSNKANESRYQDILKLYGNLAGNTQSTLAGANAAQQQGYTGAMGLYDTLGKSGAQQIAQQTSQEQATNAQNMASRGLGNTTIQPSMAAGIASRGQQNLLGLQESLAAGKAGLMTGQGNAAANFALSGLGLTNNLGESQAGVMERRTDQGPDLSMYANLIAGAAKNNVPQSGGMGGMSLPQSASQINLPPQQGTPANVQYNSPWGMQSTPWNGMANQSSSVGNMMQGASMFAPEGGGTPGTASIMPTQSFDERQAGQIAGAEGTPGGYPTDPAWITEALKKVAAMQGQSGDDEEEDVYAY